MLCLVINREFWLIFKFLSHNSNKRIWCSALLWTIILYKIIIYYQVDSDAQDVSRTVQKFSQSIGQAGNAFIFSLHGTGARNVRTGELHPYADLPSSNKVKRLSMIYNEKSPKSDELETAFSKTYNFRSRKSHRNRLVLPKALRPLVSFWKLTVVIII